MTAPQLNIRSAFARARARHLALQTGMSVTEVVEEALRGYAPPAGPAAIGRLERCGPLLVLPPGDRAVTHAEAEAALTASRER